MPKTVNVIKVRMKDELSVGLHVIVEQSFRRINASRMSPIELTSVVIAEEVHQ